MKIYTECRDCFFSEVIFGNQTCQAAMIGKFKEEDLTLEEDGFYKINGLCRSFRLPEWGDKHHDNINERLRLENQIKYSLVINLEKENKIEALLESISHLEIPPKVIYIINFSNVKPSELYQMCAKYLYKIDWNIKQPVEETSFKTFVEKLAFSKRLGSNFILIGGDKILDNKDIKSIDNLLINNKQFLFVKAKDFVLINRFILYNCELDKIEEFLLTNNKDLISYL